MKTTAYWKTIGIIATLIIIISVPLYRWRIDRIESGLAAGSPDAVAFVGSEKCGECHQPEFDRWRGSHHDLAMDRATEATVLGDFDDAVFEQFGVRTRFYRKDGRFRVRTQGEGGAMADFEVRYVFGVYPLQQYLVPFPGGRLQCLPIAWNSRDGGWYHLYPEADLDPTDWLYWTNAGQNWNGMCAECHSTNLQKNYDPAEDVYRTTWSEIDVGCEACHGPGSRHAAWAELPAMARPQTPDYRLTVQTGRLTARDQVELCAPCHSRRAILGDYTHHEADLLDSLLPTLLAEGLYYPDGQILDEVYVYGSFTQSKMYHREVRCSDCHDVHSIKPVRQGNDLCLQCHRAAVYDTYDHHFHKREGEMGDPIRGEDGEVLFEVGTGAQCVQCHMPGRNYMGIDYRPDHSFRIPRPDLSQRIGTPNACNRCHLDKTPQWAEETLVKWYGPGRPAHYGAVLAAARRGETEAGPDLIRLAGDPLYPVIVRATALDLLGGYPGEDTGNAVESAMNDPEALIRHTAVSRSDLVNLDRRRKLLAGLIYDPVTAVRIQAANQIAAISDPKMDSDQERVFQTALDEYQTAMTYSADFAFGRFNLGNLYAQLNRPDAAEREYRAAIRIDDQFYMAKVNLAMLLNRKGENAEAEKLLREALEVRQDMYTVHYNLGLLLAEKHRYQEAAEHLETAASGLPGYARVHYNLGQIWDFLQSGDKAQTALERAYALEPDNPDYLKALVEHYLRHQKHENTRRLAEGILSRNPDDRLGQKLLDHVAKQAHPPEEN